MMIIYHRIAHAILDIGIIVINILKFISSIILID